MARPSVDFFILCVLGAIGMDGVLFLFCRWWSAAHEVLSWRELRYGHSCCLRPVLVRAIALCHLQRLIVPARCLIVPFDHSEQRLRPWSSLSHGFTSNH